MNSKQNRTMRANHLCTILCASIILGEGLLCAQTITPDLKAIPSGTGWKGSTNKFTLTEKDGLPAVEGSGGEGVVWLDGFEFTDGGIAFDRKPKVSVFVNGAREPSLVVNELTERKGGSVGISFFASGTIANLKITPATGH